MKTIRLKHSVLGACAALALAAPASLFATSDLTLNTFDTGLSGVGVEWGTGAVTWDSTQDNTGNSGGSAYLDVAFSGSSDTPASDYFCFAGGNPWYQPASYDASTYVSVDFDIKYDNTSDVTISQFNDLSTWNTTMTNKNGSYIMQGWAGSGYLSGSTPGLDMNFCGSYNQMAPSFAATNIPAGAASGWTHVSLAINSGQANISAVNGIVFHKWINQSWGIQNTAHGKFWVDNIVFKGSALPPPPPTVGAPTSKPVNGLNVFLSTENSLYDRQSIVLQQTNGLSWVGAPSYPVSYTFTVVGYPTSQNCQLWMFLCPNPAYKDNAPDWNETNVALVYIQGGVANATAHFRYKVGETSGQDMYSGGGIYTNAPGTGGGTLPESGDLADISPATGGIIGKWQLVFTSASNGKLVCPDGSYTNFTMPSYNTGMFAESPAAGAPGMYLYLGGQMNNADAASQAIVYGMLAVSNSAAPFYHNFLTDTALDTTNLVTTGQASGPLGILCVSAADTAGLWVSWSLPAGGYSLQSAANLLGGALGWASPTTTPIGMVGVNKQLIPASQMPSSNVGFFRVIKRTFSQLQILLPGMTAAANTMNGYTGTPDAQMADGSGDYPFGVTVNSCDSTWNFVPGGSNDTIELSCPDGNFFVANSPADVNLQAGTAAFTVAFLADGASQITATDLTDGTKTAAVSPTVTY